MRFMEELEPPHEIKVGDTVRIKREIVRFVDDPGWNGDMDQYLGLYSKVRVVENSRDYVDVILEIDGGRFVWAESWLEKI